MLENIFTLLMLVLLQAVLGFDNLLYISLESKRAPKEKQAYVRKVGILLAVALRIILLFVLIEVIDLFQDPILHLNFTDIVTGEITIHSLIVLGGGIFIIYTAMKEIWHMIGVDDVEHDVEDGGKKKTIGQVITMIVIMNVVFSFDSILSAMALTDVFWVMATAIVIGGILMIWLSDKVANFLAKNRMYEVLGLFILFVVGIMLVTEGGELAELELFGSKIVHMSKTTFYFVIGVLVVTDLVQTRYQKKLLAEKEAHKKGH
ncbi:MAG: tellurium resistance protein TerC [Bacteroidetes bacterium MedPE-SWsnd-G2]|nr:MAG: tellurium resistance protein TerC [Bacteroidetes bacterium MedPE-SWsnd-G2]